MGFERFEREESELPRALIRVLSQVEDNSGCPIEYAETDDGWSIRTVPEDDSIPFVAMASTLSLSAKRMLGILRTRK